MQSRIPSFPIARRSNVRFALLAGLVALFTIGARPCLSQNSGPARDAWQHPEEVMDALGVRRGDVVADVGCGKGYFAFHFADRVGPAGRVYSEDIQPSALDVIKAEADRESLRQVTVVLGAPDNPGLPAGTLDFVFAMDTYHEWHEHAAMLHHLFNALKPGGIFGLIDGVAPAGLPRSYYYQHHRMPESLEQAEMTQAGFRLLRREHGFTRPDDGKQFYFLIFQKPK